MYQYKFSDEESENISKKTKQVDDLYKSFDEVDKKYNIGNRDDSKLFNESLELERQTYEKPNEEEVKKQAQNSLFEYKDENLNQIENDFINKKTNLTQQLDDLSDTTKQSKQELKQTYENVKKNASNDAIKRGLARSSIIVNKLAEYDQTMLEEFTKIEKNWNDTYNKLSAEIGLLETQKQNALDAFDISYAVKLTEKINTIYDKIDEKEKEVIEYNNKIEQLEKEYETEQAQRISDYENELDKKTLDMLKYYGEYGINQIEMIKAKEKYDLALNYFSNLPKNEAISNIENDSNLRTVLGSYYGNLLTQMGKRTK